MYVFVFLYHSYETTNGIKVRQTSYMRGNNRVIVGYYSYIGPDSKIYTTHYTADEYGYRAKSSHLPVQDVAVQPLPFVSSTPFSDPGPFATPAPFIVSSTSPPFVSSAAPFRASSPYSDGPSSTPYRAAYQPYNIGYSSTASPIVSSSTPFASTISPQFSEPKRPRFPIYGQPTAPFRGYSYTNPRINSHYSVVAQQTPAPVFFSSSTKQPLRRFPIAAVASNESPRVTPQFGNGFNEISSTPLPFQDDIPRFKEYIPPAPIVSSTPRPFNNIQPDTVLITPKPAYNPPQLPNSLSINQNLLPPYLSVGPLTSPPRPQNIFRNNDNFIRSPQFEFNESVQSSVAPLTVTDLNFRKKRNFDVKLNEKIVA